MANNITISVTAETADLQAQLQLAQSRLREFNAETKAMADQVRAGGAGVADLVPQFEQMAAATAAAKAEVAALNAEIRGNGAASVGIIGGLRQGIEELAAPMQAVTGLFRLAGEAFIAGFAVDKIVGLGTSVAAFGEQLTRLSEETGISTTKLSALKYGAEITGTSFDNFGRVLTRFAANMQTAITTPAGPAARALQALGINADYLRAHSDDLAGMLELVAQRLDQYAAGGNRAAIEAAILGQRMGAELQPVLDRLAHEGFQGLIDKGREAGMIMDDPTAKNAAKAAETFHQFEAAATGLEHELGLRLLPILTATAKALTASFESDSIAKLTPRLEELESQLRAINAEAAKDTGLAHLLDEFKSDAIKGDIAQIAAELKRLQEFEAPLRGQLDVFGSGDTGVGAGQGGGKPQGPSMAGGSGVDAAAQQEAEMYAFLQQVAQQYQQQLLQTNLQTNQQELAQDQAAFQTKETLIKADAAEGKITAQQEYQELVKLENDKFDAVAKSLEARQDLMVGDEAAQSAILSQEEIAYAKHVQALALLDQQYYQQKQREAQQESQLEKGLLQEIESAESSFISNVLGGRRSLTQSIIQLGTQLLEKEISDNLKALTTYAFTENAKKALEQGGIIYHLFAEQAKTQATEDGAAARQAADESSFAGGLASEALSAIKWISNEAAKTFAGIFSFLAPEMGPAAAGPAAAGQAVVMAAAGGVLSAAGGAWSIPSNMLALLHTNESVIPASIAEPMRAFFASGGGAGAGAAGGAVTVNLHVSAVDGASAKRFFKQNMPALASSIATAVRDGKSHFHGPRGAR